MTSRNPKSVRVARSRSGVIALIFTCALVVLAQWWYQDHFHATLRGEYIAYSPEVLDKIGAAAIFSETSSFSVSSIATENNWQLGWGDPWLKQASWWDRPAFYSKGSRRWPRRVVFLTQRRATASVSVPQLSESESQSLNALEAFDYDPTRGVLSYTGRMDESQFRDALAVNKSLDYRSAVERLFYHSSGNGLATVDDRNISTLPRSEFAELGETINKNVNDGAIPLTVSNVESLGVSKDYVPFGVEHGYFITRGTAVIVVGVLIMGLLVLFVYTRKPTYVLKLHRGSYGLSVTLALLTIPILFFLGFKEERRPVFTLSRPWLGRMPDRAFNEHSYDPLPNVSVPKKWRGRFGVDTADKEIWFRGDVLTSSEEETLVSLESSNAYQRTLRSLAFDTRRWSYDGYRPSVKALITVFDSVRSDDDFLQEVGKRFPILRRDLSFGLIGISAEDVDIPHRTGILLAFIGLVVLAGVITFTAVETLVPNDKETLGTPAKKYGITRRILMVFIHPFRSSKLLLPDTDWDRRLATIMLMIFSGLVAANVLIARLTFEPSYSYSGSIGLITEVLLVVWGCILGGAVLWLFITALGCLVHWVRQRPAVLAPGRVGARALIVTLVWAALITLSINIGLLSQEAELADDWIPFILMILCFIFIAIALVHILVVVIAGCKTASTNGP